MAERRPRHEQRGAALLLLLVLLVLGSLGLILNAPGSATAEARRQARTEAALAQARDALIGYALKYREDQSADGQPDRVYGYLPLPDLGSSRNNNVACAQEGCDAANFVGNALDTSVIGRLPWRVLGTGPLRDGDGECLWYAVAGSHQRQQRVAPMNWDTPGQLDLVELHAGTLVAAALPPHERPAAIVIAPGAAFKARTKSGSDSVEECGGNYTPGDYLDATALGPAPFNTASQASGITGNQPKPLATRGRVRAGDTLLANDIGLPVTSASLFGALRQHAYFRTDINALLDRIVGCLRDRIAAGTLGAAYGRIAGPDNDACYGQDVDPRGYYPHYKDMIFVAAPGGGASVDGQSCVGALLFGSQREAGQQRASAEEKNNPANYLETPNRESFAAGGTVFAGQPLFERVSTTQAAHQDIVRCIPTGASLNQVRSPALDALGGQLTTYSPATRILTLGRLFSITSAQRTANARNFFGCAWTPEAHAFGSGLRAHFKFRIRDTGEGFVFVIADGESNCEHIDHDPKKPCLAPNFCGAARQHLGYSGSNGVTLGIAPPKIGIEIDISRQSSFNPAASNSLANGREDPNYTGGHVGIVYWGDTADIPSGGACPCTAPRVCSANGCQLPADEDDNVHGRPLPPDASPRPAPRNPPAPPTPTLGAGVYKLDANLSKTPVDQDIHLRVELTRTASDVTAHSTTYLLETWVLKESPTDAQKILALGNTTRPMALLYPDFAAHLRDTPTIFDLPDASCGADAPCYTPALHQAWLGFTTAQGTAANDQLIDISDFFVTWLP